MTSTRKFTIQDVLRDAPTLTALARSHVEGYVGEFEFLVDCKQMVAAGGQLTPPMVKAVLNCMLHDPRAQQRLMQALEARSETAESAFAQHQDAVAELPPRVWNGFSNQRARRQPTPTAAERAQQLRMEDLDERYPRHPKGRRNYNPGQIVLQWNWPFVASTLRPTKTVHLIHTPDSTVHWKPSVAGKRNEYGHVQTGWCFHVRPLCSGMWGFRGWDFTHDPANPGFRVLRKIPYGMHLCSGCRTSDARHPGRDSVPRDLSGK
jgi:hypothetical protein